MFLVDFQALTLAAVRDVSIACICSPIRIIKHTNKQQPCRMFFGAEVSNTAPLSITQPVHLRRAVIVGENRYDAGQATLVLRRAGHPDTFLCKMRRNTWNGSVVLRPYCDLDVILTAEDVQDAPKLVSPEAKLKRGTIPGVTWSVSGRTLEEGAKTG